MQVLQSATSEQEIAQPKPTHHMSYKIKLCWLAALTIILSALIFWMGKSAYPLLGDDSSCFIPPAIQFRNGFDLINPVDIHTHRTDWARQARFMYYPPLFQYTLALLMPQGNAAGAMVALSILGILSLTSMVYLLWQFLIRKCSTPGWVETMTLSLSATGLLTYAILGSNGRPEILVMVWVSLLAGVVLFQEVKRIMDLGTSTQLVRSF